MAVDNVFFTPEDDRRILDGGEIGERADCAGGQDFLAIHPQFFNVANREEFASLLGRSVIEHGAVSFGGDVKCLFEGVTCIGFLKFPDCLFAVLGKLDKAGFAEGGVETGNDTVARITDHHGRCCCQRLEVMIRDAVIHRGC